MRIVAEYRETAVRFDRLAAEESNPILKAHFEQHAAAYRDLAVQRARKLGAKSAATFRSSLRGALT